MNKRKDKIERDNSHITTFTNKLKSEKGKCIFDNHLYRKAVIYILRVFNGLNKHHIRALVGSQNSIVSVDIQSALQLRETEHEGFMKVYWPLLNRYIDSTKEFLGRRPNDVHVFISEAKSAPCLN